MINLDENIVGIWYVQLSATSDWMCGVSKLPDGKCAVTYRFRYYDGDQSKDTFEDGDTEHWYAGTATSREVGIEIARAASAYLKGKGAVGDVYECLNDKGIKDFTERFTKMPFVHIKTVTAEEAAKYAPDQVSTN